VGEKWGKLPRGVSIKKNRSSESIQLQFLYKGVRCRELLSIPVTKANIKFADRKLAEIKNSIERKTFEYIEHFPNSAKLKVFGTASKGSNIKRYLDEYVVSAEKRGLSHTTINGYKKTVNALSSFHEILITELEARHVLHFIETSTTKEKTIRNHLSVLRSAVNKAMTEGLIKYNPVDQVKISLYTTKEVKKDARNNYDEIDQFTSQEIERIYQHCKPEELNIIQFVFNTGVRSSEWAGLKWVDIDFVQHHVHIVEAYMLGKTKGTKTKAGRRFIPLNEVAMNALAKQKEHTFLHSEYVFLNRDGKPWVHDSFRKHRWTNILKKAGVRYRIPYQMRHTFATKHISEGINLWKLAQWLGHSSPTMLFSHYGNFIESYEKEKMQNDTHTTRTKTG
jgi:integrase